MDWVIRGICAKKVFKKTTGFENGERGIDLTEKKC